MGETHIQKATYFLQQLLDVPLEFSFILYKHGPFSFDFREFLTYMEAEEFISWQAQPPYGPSLRKGDMGEALIEQFGNSTSIFDAKVNFVADWLGMKNVAELERIATALYVTQEGVVASPLRVSRLMELKPHIDVAQSQAAISELDAMRAALTTAYFG